jgi:hypothetical protein
MRRKAFIAAILVIVGSWLALQLTRNHFQYRIMRNRDKQISVTLQEIGKIKNTLTLTAQDPGPWIGCGLPPPAFFSFAWFASANTAMKAGEIQHPLSQKAGLRA